MSATLTLIIGLRVFDQVLALTGGGPVGATETLATQVYKQTFVFGQFGYGAALALILTVLVAVLALSQLVLPAPPRGPALVGLFRYARRTFARELALDRRAVVFCLPFYLLVAIALDTDGADLHSRSSSRCPDFGQLHEGVENGRAGWLGQALESSVIITVGSVVALLVIGSLCAYVIARRLGA